VSNKDKALEYLGILLTAGLGFLVKTLYEKIKVRVTQKPTESNKPTEPTTGLVLDRIPVQPGSPYIHSAKITSRLELQFEDQLRVLDVHKFYDDLKDHIDTSKAIKLESVKLEVPHYALLNSAAIAGIIRIAEYIRDTNGIRLVLMVSATSPSGRKLFDNLNRLMTTWETGQIELYLKPRREKGDKS
jgi:hypothetical protein